MSLKSRRQPVVSLSRRCIDSTGDRVRSFLFLTSPNRAILFCLARLRSSSREKPPFSFWRPLAMVLNANFESAGRDRRALTIRGFCLGSDLRKNSADGRPDRMIRMVAWARSCKWILVAITRCVLERRVMTIALNNEHSHLSSALQYKRYAIPSIIFMRLSLS